MKFAEKLTVYFYNEKRMISLKSISIFRFVCMFYCIENLVSSNFLFRQNVFIFGVNISVLVKFLHEAATSFLINKKVSESTNFDYDPLTSLFISYVDTI